MVSFLGAMIALLLGALGIFLIIQLARKGQHNINYKRKKNWQPK